MNPPPPSICMLNGHFCELFPTLLGFRDDFQTQDSLYIFLSQVLKLIFAFYARFFSYCPWFGGSETIYKACDTQYMFERHDQKYVDFVSMTIFVSYCPQFLGSDVI
jgi:hypothetical protein